MPGRSTLKRRRKLSLQDTIRDGSVPYGTKGTRAKRMKKKAVSKAFAIAKGIGIDYRVIKASASGGTKIAAIRQKFGVSQEELARVTGYSTRSIAGWEGGKPLSDSACQKLTETERLQAALSEILPPNTLANWLRTPNPALQGQTPIQVIERGESDRLWRMIFQIDANVAS